MLRWPPIATTRIRRVPIPPPSRTPTDPLGTSSEPGIATACSVDLKSSSTIGDGTSTPMATQSKAQLLNEVHTLLKRRYKPKPDRNNGRLTVLEAVIYGLCHEGSTREQANQALSRFKDDFFDWNEVRVSAIEEIQGVLAGLPDPEGRAQRLRRFLRQLFEKTYGFAIGGLTKTPQKGATRLHRE